MLSKGGSSGPLSGQTQTFFFAGVYCARELITCGPVENLPGSFVACELFGQGERCGFAWDVGRQWGLPSSLGSNLVRWTDVA